MRKIYEIAEEINTEWEKPHFAAFPYLQAMFCLETIDDNYGLDSGRSIVIYFLSNATSFKGEAARRIKAELKSLLKK